MHEEWQDGEDMAETRVQIALIFFFNVETFEE